MRMKVYQSTHDKTNLPKYVPATIMRTSHIEGKKNANYVPREYLYQK